MSEAFGWPAGTVRGALAFLIIGVALAMHAVLIGGLVYVGNYELAVAAAGALLTEAGVVTGFYFGTRAGG